MAKHKYIAEIIKKLEEEERTRQDRIERARREELGAGKGYQTVNWKMQNKQLDYKQGDQKRERKSRERERRKVWDSKEKENWDRKQEETTSTDGHDEEAATQGEGGAGDGEEEDQEIRASRN